MNHEELQKHLEENDLKVIGAELCIEATIEGYPYKAVIDVEDDMNEEDLEKVKNRVIQGFKELHLKRKENGELEESTTDTTEKPTE